MMPFVFRIISQEALQTKQLGGDTRMIKSSTFSVFQSANSPIEMKHELR
jgi:hypothetical protein